MKLIEMAFARRTYDRRGHGHAITAAHEDDLSMVLTGFASITGPKNGQIPMYIYYSPDDETFFVSGQPITSERIQKELGDGFVGLDYADRGDNE